MPCLNPHPRHCRQTKRPLLVKLPSVLVLLTFLSFHNGAMLAHASSTSAASAAAVAAKRALTRMDYRYFVAGSICAATSHGITTPLDVVKTKLQASPEVYANSTVSRALFTIVHTDGPGALLAGLGPTVVGYGMEGAIKFGIYEVLKPIFQTLFHAGSNNGKSSTTTTTAMTMAYICASVLAGAAASVLLCPMELARIKCVTDANYAGLNMRQAFCKLWQQQQDDNNNNSLSSFLGSLFGGMYAMLAKQVPYTMAKQVSFDIFAGLFYALVDRYNVVAANPNGKLSGDAIKWIVSISAAFVASIFACICSQPGDMILTETYKQTSKDKSSSSSSSFVAVVRDLYERNGLATFFTGTGARILHVGMIITSQLVIYDLVKQLLGLPATGSH